MRFMNSCVLVILSVVSKEPLWLSSKVIVCKIVVRLVFKPVAYSSWVVEFVINDVCRVVSGSSFSDANEPVFKIICCRL